MNEITKTKEIIKLQGEILELIGVIKDLSIAMTKMLKAVDRNKIIQDEIDDILAVVIASQNVLTRINDSHPRI